MLLQNENEIEAHSLDQSKPFIFYLKIRHFSVLVEPKRVDVCVRIEFGQETRPGLVNIKEDIVRHERF